MKKTVIVLLALVAVGILLYASIPALRDEIQWFRTSHRDLSEHYAAYLSKWPEGRHAPEARRLYDDRCWQDAQNLHTIQEFTVYLQLHPEGQHVAQANQSIDSLYWYDASRGNTFRSIQTYLDQYPAGIFAAEAKAVQTQLLKDDRPYEGALFVGTEEAIKEFLAGFPGHRRETQARAALKDLRGRDIVDLINEHKVELRTIGSGIDEIEVEIRRLVPHPLKVRIPVGTYFVAENSSTQNMVTTQEEQRTLDHDDWVYLSPAVACANRERDVPNNEDSFMVQRSPNQAELVKLLLVLDQANVEYAVRQAAIWIVTDDADYDDLGILISSPFGLPYSGSRVINEYEAALAMQLCEKAGINLSRKAIWDSRQEILEGLEDEPLKAWLEKKK
jgi:hypothetical protein